MSRLLGAFCIGVIYLVISNEFDIVKLVADVLVGIAEIQVETHRQAFLSLGRGRFRADSAAACWITDSLG